MEFEFPPDPYSQLLETYFPFFISYGLVLFGSYIIWKIIEWQSKRIIEWQSKRRGKKK